MGWCAMSKSIHHLVTIGTILNNGINQYLHDPQVNLMRRGYVEQIKAEVSDPELIRLIDAVYSQYNTICRETNQLNKALIELGNYLTKHH